MWSSTKSGAALCVLLGAMLGPSSAHAESESHARVKLDYAAPPDFDCPNRAAFASAIATRLGYDAVVASGEDGAKTLRVVFAREAAKASVSLQLSNAAGAQEAEKKLVSEVGACGELGAAAAFAAAMLVDPHVMLRPGRPLPTPPPRGESLDSTGPASSPWYSPRDEAKPPPAPPPSDPWRWRAGIFVAVCTGCAPTASPGAGLLLGLARGRVGVDLGARVDLPSSIATPAGKSVSTSLAAFEVFPHARLRWLRAGLLGVGGTLFGGDGDQKRASFWAAAGVRVAFEYKFANPLFVRLAADALLSLGRVALRAEGGELWSTPIAVAGANLGVGFEF